MPGKAKVPTLIYYRFQHEQPKPGDVVHCFRDFSQFRGFVQMMRGDDPDFRRMKFWEIQGEFVKDDEDDAVVRVASAKQIAV
jgi:hypothetical protein